MSLENFKNKKIEWDTVNKNFEQSVQVISGDVNSRTVTIVITDNGEPIDLTGYSVKLIYKYIYNDSSGFVMLTPIDAKKGEFSLTIPTEMTTPGIIKSNLILLNENLEQVIVSKNLKFISDDSTVTDLAQEVNNKIDDFTKLLLENMPQVMRSELNGLHAQTESNTNNIELKANSSDMTSLQSAMNSLQNKVEAFGITPENLVTIKSLLDAIANSASDYEVAELINSVNILTNNISLMSDGDYSPKANQTDLESLQSAVNNQSASISTKANKTDLDNLQTTVNSQGIAISTKAEQADLLITNQNVTTAQTTANQAETDAQTAIAKATEAKTSSLSLNGNAVSASKLATARKLGVTLQSSTYQNFDGTADVTNIGVSGVLPVVNGGTGTSDGVINTIAYAYSADGKDRFTISYPNLNLLNFNSVTLGKYYGWDANVTSWSEYRAYFKKVKVTPNSQYTISANWSNAEWLNVYAFTNESDTTAVSRYGSSGVAGVGYWSSNFVGGVTVTSNMTFTIPSNVNYIGISYASLSRDNLTLQALLNGKPKLEQGSTATPWMTSASEVTTTDYPSYVGFSNTVKTNKTSSDYKWLPMGLVSIDSATGLLKPAVIGIDYAQAHPVGSVVSNNSNSSSGYETGTWQNIGSALIGSATIYYWQRTA